MYHAIIADDEGNALDELLYVIDWQKENVAIDGTASDGEEAVKLIEKFRPVAFLIENVAGIKNRESTCCAF